MNSFEPQAIARSRRAFLSRTSAGIGSLALATMLNPSLASGSTPADRWIGVTNPPHWKPKIKRMIFLYMAGGMSHLETFDYKPKLAEMHGQPMPESFTMGQQIAQLQGAKLNCFAPQHDFKRWGKSGQMIGSIFPHIGSQIADDICIVRSMHTDAINHDPAHTFMNTGSMIPGRPAIGSWLLYGLGSETENLPGFVVLVSSGKYGPMQPIAARQWHSGFLPSQFQGVEFRSKGDPVLYVSRPKGVTTEGQRHLVDTVKNLNSLRHEALDDPEIATRIAQYEMAFRMQSSVPELMNVSGEPKHILEMYGTSGGDGTFAGNCLLARRLAERGVRFIQCYHRDWDHHGGVKNQIAGVAGEVDRGAAALVTDLKQRGMLDETLIVFATEFGRTPMAQGDGRDHHMKAFSIWLAGGGIKGGMAYGNTDELGYAAVENATSVHNLHATVLHLFGIDHKRLTFKSQGLDFRLTGVEGDDEVIKSIVA